MVEWAVGQKEWMAKHSRCPFCGCDKVSEGPSGGGSQNLYCEGYRDDPWTGERRPCNARFNSTPFGMDLIGLTDLDPSEYAYLMDPKGKQKVAAVPEPKYSAEEIVRKFTHPRKRRWWSRG